MKINMKVRWKNPQFLLQVGLAVFAPICAYQGVSGSDISTWPMLGKMLLDALKNPFIVFTCLVGLYNAITDPTTPGFSDSSRALTYSSPKDAIKGPSGKNSK